MSATFRLTNSDGSWTIPLLLSLLIHCTVAVLASTSVSRNPFRRQELLPIRLVEMPRTDPGVIPKKEEPQAGIKPSIPPHPGVNNFKRRQAAANREITLPERSAPLGENAAPTLEEPKPSSPAPGEPAGTLTSISPSQGGGEAVGGGASAKGGFGVAPVSGRDAGNAGAAGPGLGGGTSAAGSPTAAVKTNREAKPIKTVRAAYPSIALRLGTEGDVTLRIEVDPEGKVTNAEVIKSGGAGFDEEALKAVKQSRFEPAQKDGHSVPAEFTYIYRFRLQR